MSPHRIGLRPRARPLRRASPSGNPTLKGLLKKPLRAGRDLTVGAAYYAALPVRYAGRMICDPYVRLTTRTTGEGGHTGPPLQNHCVSRSRTGAGACPGTCVSARPRNRVFQQPPQGGSESLAASLAAELSFVGAAYMRPVTCGEKGRVAYMRPLQNRKHFQAGWINSLSNPRPGTPPPGHAYHSRTSASYASVLICR